MVDLYASNPVNLSTATTTHTSSNVTSDLFLKGLIINLSWSSVSFTAGAPIVYIIGQSDINDIETKIILKKITLTSGGSVDGARQDSKQYEWDTMKIGKVWVEIDKNTATAGIVKVLSYNNY